LGEAMRRADEDLRSRVAELEQALADALTLVTQLEEALESRDVIGQAKGVLMERYHTGPDEAYRRLTEQSQRLNIKLRQIAEFVASQAASRERSEHER
jgi:AmiR/NasT family two-component response regulator